MNFLKNQFKKVSENTGTFLETASKSIKETTTKTINAATVGIKKSTDAIAKSYIEKKTDFFVHHPNSCKDFLVEIDPRLFFMVFPDEELQPKYSKLLNIEYGQRYRIWNVSEYSYKTAPFNDQVFEYVHVGYLNPPLLDIFLICKEVLAWITADDTNIAIVHCQAHSIRSALIFGCIQFVKGESINPTEKMDLIASVDSKLLENWTK